MFSTKTQRKQRGKKGDNVVRKLPVTLEDMYVGKQQRMRLQKQIQCPDCDGKGSKKPGAAKICQQCKGQGVKVGMRQVGAMFFQQIHEKCTYCEGQGQTINPRDRCGRCEGRRVVNEKKSIEINVERGSVNGQRITFEREGDQDPDTEPGDVIIVLEQQPHR
ncbi:MAG: hypothetical protein EZS28_053538, partial [Streblomastix strix]